MRVSSNHLQWIHDRLVHVHNENPNYDYMIKLREDIASIKEIESMGPFLLLVKEFMEKVKAVI